MNLPVALCRTLTMVMLPVCLMSAGIVARAQFPQPNGGSIQQGKLPAAWDKAGPDCAKVPEWQLHEYNSDLYIMRQSGCTDYEKPFVYLLFGKERALLLDTGSRNGNIVPALQRAVHRWLQQNHRQSIPLIVAHSHAHGDHTWGDGQIKQFQDAAMPITFLPATVDDTKAFYKITNWPEDTGSVDLGGRIIDVIPIPGHDVASVALYDRQTAVLLTGDSAYPGRLYIRDFAAFKTSNQRMIRFTQDKPVAHILGCHIEETSTPFLDYPVRTVYQPEEHELQLPRGVLLEIQAGLDAMGDTPQRVAYRDFSLWPNAPRPMAPHPAE